MRRACSARAQNKKHTELLERVERGARIKVNGSIISNNVDTETGLVICKAFFDMVNGEYKFPSAELGSQVETMATTFGADPTVPLMAMTIVYYQYNYFSLEGVVKEAVAKTPKAKKKKRTAAASSSSGAAADADSETEVEEEVEKLSFLEDMKEKKAKAAECDTLSKLSIHYPAHDVIMSKIKKVMRWISNPDLVVSE